ncbi:ubiquinone/menaquinone biosynthesis methyltransferase [Candidatus Cloacimonadota bacterium]
MNEKKFESNNKFITKIFSEVPETYEMLNHILTFGFDILWRKKAVKTARKAKPGKWVDMCTGTGETAIYLNKITPEGTKVYAVDLTAEMMEVARKKRTSAGIEFVQADVKSLPFEDNTFDLITISFATRNINLNKEILIQTFAEFYRVLKPEGIFVNLETSKPKSKILKLLFDLYIKLFVKFLGSRISGSVQAYNYLSKTIPKFYSAEDLAAILLEAGFDEVEFEKLIFGIAAIHKSYKKV